MAYFTYGEIGSRCGWTNTYADLRVMPTFTVMDQLREPSSPT